VGQTDGPKVAVLLVDDNDDMRTLTRMLLELDGRFTVAAEATNGAHAVGLAKVHQPDVVILDVLMPVLDGETALPMIQKVAPDAVVVAFSALAANHPRVARMMGADAHISKSDSATLPDLLYELWLSRDRRVAVRASER